MPLRPGDRGAGSTRTRKRRRGSLGLGATVLVVLALSLAPFDLLLPKVPVAGIVRDAVSAEPIAGASVRLGQSATETDRTGGFSIERGSLVEPLQVDADGYHTRRSRFWVPGDRDVELLPRAF